MLNNTPWATSIVGYVACLVQRDCEEGDEGASC